MSAFEDYYMNIYKDEWPELKEALLRENNNYKEIKGETSSYFLDQASYDITLLLPIKDSDSILDMCSAPGGKALSILSRMSDKNHITCNEINTNRRFRLLNVLKEFSKNPNYKVTGFDASKWLLYEKSSYDALLCDLPCSSERHLLKNEKELAKFSLSKVKRTLALQFSILCSALEVVKVGGHILVSTCSINPNENNLLIKKLIKRREDRFSIIKTSLSYSKELDYGSIIMPSKDQSSGPLFFILLRREN